MFNVALLAHYDDGKQKYQSHKVYLKYPDTYEGFQFEQAGYGESKDEAYLDFIEKYKSALKQLDALNVMLLETDAIPSVDVDCMGYPIFRLDCQCKSYGKLLSEYDLHKQLLGGTLYIEQCEKGEQFALSGDIQVTQMHMIHCDDSVCYFRELGIGLLISEYNKTWRAFKVLRQIY